MTLEPSQTQPPSREGSRLASPVQRCLEVLYQRYRGLQDGRVASYIPELAKADPQHFAICLATVDGEVYEIGDSRHPFTIQSISKPLTYGLALDDLGVDAVLAKIAVEPTGDAFNSISLEPDSGRPLNPMINAGAIAAASLVAGRSPQDRLERLLAVYSTYAGRALSVDEAVYRSESATGHRNRAIGFMLRNFEILSDPDPALDLYFRQCSVAVDCRDLSLMAATFANGGVNPLTGERAISMPHLDRVLSVMTTCGLYDAAGQWVFHVGMPAKSGVGGGILAVLPGQFGLAVYSPPLDAQGNSVRGVAVCKDFSRELELHFLRTPPLGPGVLRSQYDLSAVRSKRYRSAQQIQELTVLGHEARVYELQGALNFSSMEQVARVIVQHSTTSRFSVLDFQRVTTVNDAACRMLTDLLLDSSGSGHQLVFAHVGAQARWWRELDEARTAVAERPVRLVSLLSRDDAIEWCENRLLQQIPDDEHLPRCAALADHALCSGLYATELGALEAQLVPQVFQAGEMIVSHGDAADAVYLLMQGVVTVSIPGVDGRPKRIATISAGMSFGDAAVIDDARRSADVVASTAVRCLVLSVQAFRNLSIQQPRMQSTILSNMLRDARSVIARLSDEVSALRN